jgi:ribulose-phosphate 3-epimerase
MSTIPVEIVPASMSRDRKSVEVIATRVSGFARSIQLDIMDGIFVPAKSWPFMDTTVETIELPPTPLIWEADLMVRAQATVVVACLRAGVERIIGHIEAFETLDEARDACALWREAGAKEVGMALVNDTPLSAIAPLIEDKSIDSVQVMGIAVVGVQGSPFESQTIARVAELRAKYPELTIIVDGGVNETNIVDLVRAGANRLAVGSALLRAPNLAPAYAHLLTLATEAQ